MELALVIVLALVVLVMIGHKGHITFQMTQRLRLPYHASQRIEDTLSRLRDCEELVVGLSDEALAPAGVRKLTTAMKLLVRAQTDLAQIRRSGAQER